jgi:hypothetical protein
MEQLQLFCNWTNAEGFWETECKNAFSIEDGTPEQNRMNYCCFCGKPICTIIPDVK